MNAQTTASQDILGIYDFVNSAGTHKRLAACNGTIYYDNNGTWTAGLTGWTANKVRFVTFLDRVFAFNGVDAPKSSADGINWDSTMLSGAPTAKYAEVFVERIYATGDSSNPDRVYYSSRPAAGTITWSSDDYFDVNPKDNANITGLSKGYNRLLVPKENGLYRVAVPHSTEPDRIIDVGASSNDSVRYIGGIVFFANRYGVYAYTGQTPKFISQKVQKWIDAISDYTALTAEVDENHYYLFIGNVTVDGTAYTDVVLEYTISLNSWNVLINIKAKAFGNYTVSGVRNLYFGNGNGQVMKLFDGNSDNGSAIDFEARTSTIDFGDSSVVKFFQHGVFHSSSGTGITVYYAKNGGSFASLGTLSADIKRLNITDKANYIQFKLIESSINSTFTFNGFSLKAMAERILRKKE